MSGNFSDERPAKKRRGGKKAKKQQVLRERFERGEFVPKAFVSTGAGSSADRSAKSSSIVAFPKTVEAVIKEDSVPVTAAKQQGQTNPSFSASSVEGKATSSQSTPIVSSPKFPGLRSSELSVPSPNCTPVLTTSFDSCVVVVPKAKGLGPAASESVAGIPKAEGLAFPLAPVVPVVQPKTLPKAPPKQSLSAPLVNLGKAGGGPVIVTSKPPPPLEVRVSLDYHNCLNLDRAGSPTFEGIRASHRKPILDFLQSSETHRIGICSYIGEKGQKSRERRARLRQEVVDLNTYLSNHGIPQERLVVLEITADHFKRCVDSSNCSAHVDDKTLVIESIRSRQVVRVQVTSHKFGRWPCVQSVGEGLQSLTRLVVPRVFHRGFYQ